MFTVTKYLLSFFFHIKNSKLSFLLHLTISLLKVKIKTKKYINVDSLQQIKWYKKTKCTELIYLIFYYYKLRYNFQFNHKPHLKSQQEKKNKKKTSKLKQ